jgi:RNA polymerase sigma-70 factor (ECF subfamily)
MPDNVLAPTTQPSLSDEEVVRRVCAGEVALFELVMRRNNARVFRAIRSIVRDADEAEDVMQQAYVNAYLHLGEFEGRALLSTWLTRIAVHEALARARHNKKWTSFDEEGTERELLGVLEDAIDVLPGAFRAVFVLRVVEGMSVTETAGALDIAEETVKTRLFRARALLKEALVGRTDAVATHAFEFHLSRCDRVVAGVLGKLAVMR